jgi:hypothetical protein
LEHVGVIGFVRNGLVVGDLFGFLHQIRMKKTFQMVGMFLDKSLLFLFHHVNPPHLHEFLLFGFLPFLLLGLSILIKLELPKPFDLPLMLIFLNPAFFPCHLFETFLLSKSFKHFLFELFLQKDLLLLLLTLCLHVLTVSLLKQVLEKLLFLALFCLFFIVLFFFHELVVLNAQVLQLLNLFFTCFLCLFQSQVDYFFLFLLSLGLFSLLLVSLVEFLLVLGEFL